MKYFHWYKGLTMIALAATLTAQGSIKITPSDIKAAPDNNGAIGNIKVVAGQSQNISGSANLSLPDENKAVTVEKNGTVTLSAGKSISLLPGTRISAGGFLYASIETTSKPGKKHRKQVCVVTVEEKIRIEEQASLSDACKLFSPFSSRKGHLHAGDAEQGSFYASSNEFSAVTPEQQRTMAIEGRLLPEMPRRQILLSYKPVAGALAFRAETLMVLRL